MPMIASWRMRSSILAVATAMALLPAALAAQTSGGSPAPTPSPTPTTAPTVVALPPPSSLGAGPPSPSRMTVADVPSSDSQREAPVNGVLYIYGNERCPTDANGNEIVVCVRRSASERFRLPKDLRPDSIKPQYQSWADRQQGALAVGAAGNGSCSPTGVGGASGCASQAFAEAAAEKRARKREKEAEDKIIHPF